MAHYLFFHTVIVSPLCIVYIFIALLSPLFLKIYRASFVRMTKLNIEWKKTARPEKLYSYAKWIGMCPEMQICWNCFLFSFCSRRRNTSSLEWYFLSKIVCSVSGLQPFSQIRHHNSVGTILYLDTGWSWIRQIGNNRNGFLLEKVESSKYLDGLKVLAHRE